MSSQHAALIRIESLSWFYSNNRTIQESYWYFVRSHSLNARNSTKPTRGTKLDLPTELYDPCNGRSSNLEDSLKHLSDSDAGFSAAK